MVKIKSKVSICGKINLKPDEVKAIPEELAKEMVEAGYAEYVDKVAMSQPEEEEPEEDLEETSEDDSEESSEEPAEEPVKKSRRGKNDSK